MQKIRIVKPKTKITTPICAGIINGQTITFETGNRAHGINMRHHKKAIWSCCQLSVEILDMYGYLGEDGFRLFHGQNSGETDAKT